MEERKVPSRRHAVPPIMIHSGTPCPPETPATHHHHHHHHHLAAGSTFTLPQISQHRSVVGGGHYVLQHQQPQPQPLFLHQQPDDLYALKQDPTTTSSFFYGSAVYGPPTAGLPAPASVAAAAVVRPAKLPGGSSVQLLQLPLGGGGGGVGGGGGGGGGGAGFVPQSPCLSDVSSVRLTPRSPLSRLSLVDPLTMPAKQGVAAGAAGNKTPRLPLYNLGYGVGGSSVELEEEANPSPLFPPLHSLSPYLSAGIGDVPSLSSLISPLHSTHHLSRKRALSSSPFSEFLDFNAIIRSSPNSLVTIVNGNGSSPYPAYQPAPSPQLHHHHHQLSHPPLPTPGSIGHLTVHQLLSPTSPSPNSPLALSPQIPGGAGQYTVQKRKTSIEHEHHSNGTTTTITNQITLHKPPLSRGVSMDDPTPNLAVQQQTDDFMDLDYNCLSCKSTSSASSTMPQTQFQSEPQPQASEPNDPLVCLWNNCGKLFEDQESLVQHIEALHIEKGKVEVFTCHWQSCPRNKKPFNARYKLLIHMRIHSGEKPNKCTYPGCAKAFSRLENLKIHLRTHTGEKPYVCQYHGCSKSFSNSSDRSKHQKTHYDQKPYVCNYPNCCKKYTDPSSLRKHCKIHLQHQKKPRNDSEDTTPEGKLDQCLTIQPLICNSVSPKVVPRAEGGGDSKPHKPARAKASKKQGRTPNPCVGTTQSLLPDSIQDFPATSVDYLHPVHTSYLLPSSHCHLQPPPSPHAIHLHSPAVPSPDHSSLHVPSPAHQPPHAHSPSGYQVVPPASTVSSHSPVGGGGNTPHSPMQVVLSPMQALHCSNGYGVAVPYPAPQYHGYGDPGIQPFVAQHHNGMQQQQQQLVAAGMGLQPPPCFYQEGHPSLLHS